MRESKSLLTVPVVDKRPPHLASRGGICDRPRVLVSDPESQARPRENVTGTCFLAPDLMFQK